MSVEYNPIAENKYLKVIYLLSIPKIQERAGHEDISAAIGYLNLTVNSSRYLVGWLGNDNGEKIQIKCARISMK